MENKKKYSILIPTMNGGKYIEHAVKSVLFQNYNNFELIVSVNHSEDDTLDILEKFQDKRLKIIIPKKKLSMAGHYEWCISNANADWLTILGDDDGIMPNFFEYNDYLIQKWKNIEVFSFKRAYFFWPGSEDIFGNTVVHYNSGNYEKIVKCKSMLFRVLMGLNEHYDLPQIYTNNLIKKTVVERVKSFSNGNFYHEMTPDVYSGVALSLVLKKYLKVGKPLFWTGSSPKSLGVAIAKNTIKDKSKKEVSNTSSEHFELALSDGLGIAKELSPELYKKSDLSLNIYVYSAWCNVPFKEKVFNSKFVQYIVLSSALAKNYLPSSLNVDSSRDFRKQFRKYIKHKKINRLLLYTFFGILFIIISAKQIFALLKKYAYIYFSLNKEFRNLMYVRKRGNIVTISKANELLEEYIK